MFQIPYQFPSRELGEFGIPNHKIVNKRLTFQPKILIQQKPSETQQEITEEKIIF